MPSMLSVAFIIICGIAAAGAFFLLARRPARAGEEESHAVPFECGAPPSAPYPRRVAVQYFLTAILFVIILVALVLVVIWARDLIHTIKTDTALSALIGAGIFCTLVATGFIYAWRVGALDWEK